MKQEGIISESNPKHIPEIQPAQLAQLVHMQQLPKVLCTSNIAVVYIIT